MTQTLYFVNTILKLCECYCYCPHMTTKKWQTRMHSSRMHTGQTLTISPPRKIGDPPNMDPRKLGPRQKLETPKIGDPQKMETPKNWRPPKKIGDPQNWRPIGDQFLGDIWLTWFYNRFDSHDFGTGFNYLVLWKDLTHLFLGEAWLTLFRDRPTFHARKIQYCIFICYFFVFMQQLVPRWSTLSNNYPSLIYYC